MLKSSATHVQAILIAIACLIFPSGLSHAADDTFVGTWYGEFQGLSFRVELNREGDQLEGNAILLLGNRRGDMIPYRVTEANQEGDLLDLTLESRVPGYADDDLDKILVKLRVPKNELTAELRVDERGERIAFPVTQDAPELATRFAEAVSLSEEEVKQIFVERSVARQRASCANHLKQLGLVMKMFANESRGELFPKANRLRFAIEEIYPEYLSDPNVLMCPTDDAEPEEGLTSDENVQWHFEHSRYWYINHVVTDEVQGQAYLAAYRKVVEEGDGDVNVNLDDTTGTETRKIHRLREGVERFLITDINDPGQSAVMQSTIPVLIERPGTHEPDGGNVLFMDGHVEYIKYPGKFPMTKAFIKGLSELDDLARH